MLVIRMKTINILSKSIPFATCAIWWMNTHGKKHSSLTGNLLAFEEQMKLQQVQVIFRHGARTPTSWSKERFKSFPNIKPASWDKNRFGNDLPDVDVKYTLRMPDGDSPSSPLFEEGREALMEGGCTTGLLTNVGKQQLYDLGQKICERYITEEQLVSPQYESGDVYVRSSHFRRTIYSALHFMAGLYKTGSLNETVCIETKDVDKDDIHPNLSGCANFAKWAQQIWSTPNHCTEEAELEDYLKEKVGVFSSDTNIWLGQYNDLIRCRRAHDLPIPEYLIDNEEAICRLELRSHLKLFGKGNTSIIRNCIGSFLETICSTVTKGIEGTGSHKLFLYSGHDWTLIPLLIAFEVDVHEWPPFASYITIELYKSQGNKHFVRVLYNDQPIMFDTDSGEDYISSDNFFKIMEMYRVADYDSDCGNSCLE